MLSFSSDLKSGEIDEVMELAVSCALAEDAPTLVQRVQSLVSSGQSSSRIVRFRLELQLVAIGLVNLGGSATPGCVIAVDPSFRRRGFGTRMLQVVTSGVAQREIRIWNHGDCRSGLDFAQRHRMTLLQQLNLMEVVNSPNKHLSHLKPRTDCTIRVVDPSALSDDWHQLVNESYNSSSVSIELATRPWWPTSKIVVAETESGNCVGLLVLRVVIYRGASAIENHLMAVHPSVRGLGIGSALTNALVVFANNNLFKYTISYVDRSNVAALEAHKNSGFFTVGSDSVFRYAW